MVTRFWTFFNGANVTKAEDSIGECVVQNLNVTFKLSEMYRQSKLLHLPIDSRAHKYLRRFSFQCVQILDFVILKDEGEATILAAIQPGGYRAASWPTKAALNL